RHPLPNAIKMGFKDMSVSLHQITDEEIDAGCFLAKMDFPINYNRSYSWNQDFLLKALPLLAGYLCDLLRAEDFPSKDLVGKAGDYYPPLERDELLSIMNSGNLKRWEK